MQNQSNLEQPLKTDPPVAHTLSYTQSLRAIGQALDVLRLNSFDLQNNGTEYILTVGISGSVGNLDEHLVKAIVDKLWGGVDHVKEGVLDLKAIPITRSDIDRLDAEGRSRRRGTSGELSPTANLSLSLRVLGDFLDEKRAVTFSISWSADLVMVQYQTPSGNHGLQDFTTKNLYDRGVHARGVQMYLRRFERMYSRLISGWNHKSQNF